MCFRQGGSLLSPGPWGGRSGHSSVWVLPGPLQGVRKFRSGLSHWGRSPIQEEERATEKTLKEAGSGVRRPGLSYQPGTLGGSCGVSDSQSCVSRHSGLTPVPGFISDGC